MDTVYYQFLLKVGKIIKQGSPQEWLICAAETLGKNFTPLPESRPPLHSQHGSLQQQHSYQASKQSRVPTQSSVGRRRTSSVSQLTTHNSTRGGPQYSINSKDLIYSINNNLAMIQNNLNEIEDNATNLSRGNLNTSHFNDDSIHRTYTETAKTTTAK